MNINSIVFKNLKKNFKKKTARSISLAIILIIIAYIILKCIFFVAEYLSIPSVTDDDIKYPIRGVDVSSYQGDIDWEVLSSQNISFAYIKATEGKSHVDSKFSYNFTNGRKTNLKIGAYHFMSFETSGEDQAENFISNVPCYDNSLPPVIDVELYGSFIANHPSKDLVHSILTPLIERLEEHYGKEPIIYCNTFSYEHYIQGNYDNPIWYANLSLPDYLPDGNSWEFLQYSFTGKLKGYSGNVSHIDLNVYNGSKLDFIKNY